MICPPSSSNIDVFGMKEGLVYMYRRWYLETTEMEEEEVDLERLPLLYTLITENHIQRSHGQ